MQYRLHRKNEQRKIKRITLNMQRNVLQFLRRVNEFVMGFQASNILPNQGREKRSACRFVHYFKCMEKCSVGSCRTVGRYYVGTLK
jgi:hypothetical protein